MIRVLLKIVAWTDFEDEVAQVLGRHLDGDVDPLAGAILPSHDAGVAPGATYHTTNGNNLYRACQIQGAEAKMGILFEALFYNQNKLYRARI